MAITASRLHYVATAAGLLGTFVAMPAQAIDKIYDPYVTKGEAEIEYAGFRSDDSDKSKNNRQGHEVEVGYGVTDYWKLELTGVVRHEPEGPTKVDAVEVENLFQFYKPGQNWLDSGMLLTYGHALHEGDPDILEAKLLLQKNYPKFVSLANIGLEQGIGSDNKGGPDVSLAWNNRYLLNPHFEPGIEIQSDFGKTSERKAFDEEEHFIGPSAYGTIVGDVRYEAAYLFGVTDASPSSAARILIEYELEF